VLLQFTFNTQTLDANK